MTPKQYKFLNRTRHSSFHRRKKDGEALWDAIKGDNPNATYTCRKALGGANEGRWHLRIVNPHDEPINLKGI